jgi:magnesium transporter
MQNEFLINLFSLEKSLVYYLNAINSNGALINRMKQSDRKINFSRKALNLLMISGLKMNSAINRLKLLKHPCGLMDARVSIVSNNLNILMKNLTYSPLP